MLPPYLSRFPDMIGWPGGIGFALIAAAVALIMTLSLPARDENISLSHEIMQLEQQLRQPSGVTSAAEVRERLDDFIDALPRHDEVNDRLNLLHNLAASHHLSMKNSEYRPTQNKAGNIRQLRIVVKTEGEYSELRGFLRKIPQVLPTLVISQLSLTRQKISLTRLESVMEFNFYYSQSEMKRNDAKISS